MKLRFIAETDKLVRALKLADRKTRDNVSTEIRRGTVAVLRGATSRVKVRSGELQSSIRDEYGKDGLIGFVKAGFGRLDRRSRSVKAARRSRNARRRVAKAKSSASALRSARLGEYAPIIERGDPRRNRQPQPFLYPALGAETPKIKSGIARAMETGMDSAMEVSR